MSSADVWLIHLGQWLTDTGQRTLLEAKHKHDFFTRPACQPARRLVDAIPGNVTPELGDDLARDRHTQRTQAGDAGLASNAVGPVPFPPVGAKDPLPIPVELEVHPSLRVSRLALPIQHGSRLGDIPAHRAEHMLFAAMGVV